MITAGSQAAFLILQPLERRSFVGCLGQSLSDQAHDPGTLIPYTGHSDVDVLQRLVSIGDGWKDGRRAKEQCCGDLPHDHNFQDVLLDRRVRGIGAAPITPHVLHSVTAHTTDGKTRQQVLDLSTGAGLPGRVGQDVAGPLEQVSAHEWDQGAALGPRPQVRDFPYIRTVHQGVPDTSRCPRAGARGGCLASAVQRPGDVTDGGRLDEVLEHVLDYGCLVSARGAVVALVPVAASPRHWTALTDAVSVGPPLTLTLTTDLEPCHPGKHRCAELTVSTGQVDFAIHRDDDQAGLDERQEVTLGPQEPVQVHSHHVGHSAPLSVLEHASPGALGTTVLGCALAIVGVNVHDVPAAGIDQCLGAGLLPVDAFLVLNGLTEVQRCSWGHTGVYGDRSNFGQAHASIREVLARNRLIAALATTTVIVEAGARSGALNTANHAGQLGRTVFAVPGPYSSSASVGCHRLIADRRAEIVVQPRDPAETAVRLWAGERIVAGAEVPIAGARTDPEVLRVVDALAARRPTPLDEVARRSGLSLADTTDALALAELQGLVRTGPGGWTTT